MSQRAELNRFGGTLDALHPQWPRLRHRMPIVAPLLLAVMGAMTIQAIRFWFMVPGRELMRPLGGLYAVIVENAAFVSFAFLVGLFGRLVRWRLLATFGLLFGARILAEFAINVATSIGPLSTQLARNAYPWPQAIVELILWSSLVAFLLRHRLQMRVGFAVGAVLELLLTSQVSLVFAFYRQPLSDWLAAFFPWEWLHDYPTLTSTVLYVPGYVGWIGLALWAAVVASLAVDRRSRPDRPPAEAA